MHKSQVHRAVQTLKDMGFLNQNPETEKYSLGWRAFEVGVAAVRRLGFGPGIQLLLREQAAKVEGTVSIRVLDGESVVVVERVEGSGLFRVHNPPGTRLPWNFGAPGKLFCAFSSVEWTKQMIRKHGLTAYTELSIVRTDEYLDELKRIRDLGYAVSDGDDYLGVYSAAAPIFDPTGDVMAALMIGGIPSVGLSKKKRTNIIKVVTQSAKFISDLVMEGAKTTM